MKLLNTTDMTAHGGSMWLIYVVTEYVVVLFGVSLINVDNTVIVKDKVFEVDEEMFEVIEQVMMNLWMSMLFEQFANMLLVDHMFLNKTMSGCARQRPSG